MKFRIVRLKLAGAWEMTKQDSQDPEHGTPVGENQRKSPVAPSPVPKNEDEREIDHRGVVMPRRTRIGGIIMPQ